MNWQPSASLDTIAARARLYQQIRHYFAGSDCLEVDTPLLDSATNTDPDIGSISASNAGTQLYLQSSPEFAMKRLLSAGSGSIYQICHAFRENEAGRRHRSEFTLLEWYRTGFNYQALMDEMEGLIDILNGQQNHYRRLSYRALFLEFTGIDVRTVDVGVLRRYCEDKVPGTDTNELDFDQCLDLLISLVIEPTMQGFVFVYDYPISQAALARVKSSDPSVAERFELFYNGIELANGFSELTDADQQRRRFEADNRQRAERDLPIYAVDEAFLGALESGLPECAGVALGLDRLLMVFEDLDEIDQVMTF